MAAGFDKDARVTRRGAGARVRFRRGRHADAPAASRQSAPAPLPPSRRPGRHQPARLQQWGPRAGAPRRIAARPGAGIVGVNIGANKDSADRIADYVAGVERFAAVADYLTVNISSPNTPGFATCRRREALDPLLTRVEAARDALRPAGAAGAASSSRPTSTMRPAPRSSIAIAHGVDGLIVSNTTLARDGLSDAMRPKQAASRAGRSFAARRACSPASSCSPEGSCR